MRTRPMTPRATAAASTRVLRIGGRVLPTCFLVWILAGTGVPTLGSLPPPEETEPAGGSSRPGDLDLLRLASWLTGGFSSAQQAAADSAYYDVRLRMVPIWPSRGDGIWLYVEQAIAGHEDRPYRQRAYRLRRLDEGCLESAVFTLPDPEAWIGLWRDPARAAHWAPDDLSEREGCAIRLRAMGDSLFVGSTQEEGCGSELRGASYATSEVTIRERVLISWDRGFDADGRQVWGAETGGYVFRKEAEAAGPAGEPR